MSLRYCLVYWCLMLLFVEALQGQQARVDDTQAFVNACQSIEKTLHVRTKFLKASRNVPLEEDDFTAAGQACNRLNNAISISDPAKTRLAVAALRAALRDSVCLPHPPKNNWRHWKRRPRELPETISSLALPISRSGLSTPGKRESQRLFEAST